MSTKFGDDKTLSKRALPKVAVFCMVPRINHLVLTPPLQIIIKLFV